MLQIMIETTGQFLLGGSLVAVPFALLAGAQEAVLRVVVRQR